MADDVKTDDATDDTKAADKANDTKASTDTDAGKPANDDVAALKATLTKVRKERDAFEKAQRDAELSKLPELERAKTEAAELGKANAKLSSENMRMKLALELGLDWTIAKRLTGETEDELREDALELAKKFGSSVKEKDKADTANRRPATSNDAKKQGAAGGHTMNDLLRGAAGK